jgi:hypothetical protein
MGVRGAPHTVLPTFEWLYGLKWITLLFSKRANQNQYKVSYKKCIAAITTMLKVKGQAQ